MDEQRTPLMKVYWIRSQAPRRVLALVKHLGLEAEFVEPNLRAGELQSAEYARLNPNMKCPVLIDGEDVFWESSAIMAHLCIKAGSDMWPAQRPAEQVEVLRWLSWNDQHWQRAVGDFYFEHIVKATFGFGLPDRSALEPKADGLLKLGKVLDDHLAGREFVACNRLTIADFQLASMATDWKEAEMPLSGFTNILRWLDRLLRIPAWAQPWPAVA